jgi:6-phosphogluconate dehydrogenase (decarboxylating)
MRIQPFPSGLLLICCFVAITGCSNLANFTLASPEVADITDIKNEEFLEKTIKIQGKVEKIIPLLNSYLYLLKEENQSIWVMTNKNAPTKLQLVTIEALLKKEKIVIDGEEKSEFYLEEIDRITK